MLNNSLRLPDGRYLGFAFYGPEGGKPVLYYHGTPSSRLEPLLLQPYGIDLTALLNKFKLKLVAVDRPGNGLSTFNPTGTFLSFAEDVFHLLQHLGVERCSVLGWSGAGPFTLATAYKYPSTIDGVYIFAGFTASFSDPAVFKNMYGNKLYFGACRKVPWLMRLGLRYVSGKNPQKPIPRFISQLPKVDHKLMEDPVCMNTLATVSLKEACRSGSKGPVYEAGMYFNDFGFDLSSIQQMVHFWWGTEDKNVTDIHPQTLEKKAPNHVMHYKAGEGHLSIYIKYFEEVLNGIEGNRD